MQYDFSSAQCNRRLISGVTEMRQSRHIPGCPGALIGFAAVVVNPMTLPLIKYSFRQSLPGRLNLYPLYSDPKRSSHVRSRATGRVARACCVRAKSEHGATKRKWQRSGMRSGRRRLDHGQDARLRLDDRNRLRVMLQLATRASPNSTTPKSFWVWGGFLKPPLPQTPPTQPKTYGQ